MLPFRTWQRPRRVLFIAAFVVGLAAVFIPTTSARGGASVSVLRVQPLPGKPLISGRVNVVAVHNPFRVRRRAAQRLEGTSEHLSQGLGEVRPSR